MRARNLLRLMAAGAFVMSGCRHFFVGDGSVDAADAIGSDGSDMVGDAAFDGDATIEPDADDVIEVDADGGVVNPRILFPLSGTTIGSTTFTARMQVPADLDWSQVGGEVCFVDMGTHAAWDTNCERMHPPADGGLPIMDVDGGAPTGERVVEFTLGMPHGVVFFRLGELTGPEATTPGPRDDSAFARVSEFVEINVPRGPDHAPSTGRMSWGSFPDFDRDGLMDIVAGGLGVHATGAGGPGEVYMYSGASLVGASASAPVVNPESSPPPSGAEFGASLASAGDINGDGYIDLIVGQPFGGSWGSVFVYFGGESFYTEHPMSQVVTGDSLGARDVNFGMTVASIGDIDLDGYSDVIVSAPARNGVDGGATGAGAYVLHGSPTGLLTGTSRIFLTFAGPPAANATVAGLGDIDGDGLGDFALGNGGTVIVYTRGGFGSTTLSDFTAGPSFGTSIASIGDFNHDGRADFAIGAPETRRVLVYSGDVSGSPTLVQAVVPTSAPIRFGIKLSGGGDLNADGFPDFIVGSEEGVANVYPGSADWVTGLSDPHNVSMSSCGGSCPGGAPAVSLNLDYDGDGASDAVVGAASGVPGSVSRFLTVWRGSSSWPGGPQFTLVGPPDDAYGQSLALAPRRRIDPFLRTTLFAFGLAPR